MRILRIPIVIAVVAVLTLALVACGDSGTSASTSPSPTMSMKTMAPMPTITTTGGLKEALQAGDYTEALKSLAAVGLDKALATMPKWTVFIPNNDAFGQLPLGAVATYAKNGQLKPILEYHVVQGQQIILADVTSATAFKTLEGEDITIDMSGSTYTVNGAPIVKAVQTPNGIIYEIGAVLVPPSIAGTPAPSASMSATP